MNTIVNLSELNTVTDWDQVKANTLGVIFRLGYSDFGSGKQLYDGKYADFLNNCRTRQIPYGLYYFPQSVTEEEALNEADFILDSIRGAHLSFPLYLDSELAETHVLGRADGLDREKRTRLLKIILDALKRNGISCGIYASTNWLQNRLVMSEIPDVSIWCVQYNTDCTYEGEVDIWQYSGSGSIPGIADRVDLNRLMSPFAFLGGEKFKPYKAVIKKKSPVGVFQNIGDENPVFVLPPRLVIQIVEEKDKFGRLADISGWVELSALKKG